HAVDQSRFPNGRSALVKTFCVLPADKVRIFFIAMSVRKGSSADRAFHKPGQPVLTGGDTAALYGLIGRGNQILRILKQLWGDRSFVLSGNGDPIPLKIPYVKAILEDISNITPLKQPASLGVDSHFIDLPGDGSWLLVVIAVLVKDV